MLHNLKLQAVSNYETLPRMKSRVKSEDGEKPKYPNNLLKLMARDGVTAKQISDVWGVDMGDVSQRIHGKVSITTKRRELLTKHFGWSASEIYGDTAGSADLRESEIALLDCLKFVLSALTLSNIISQEGLKQALSYQYEEYRHKNQPRAMEVMAALQEYVSGKPDQSKREIIDRFLHMLPRGSA
jgi:hypothetical protein